MKQEMPPSAVCVFSRLLCCSPGGVPDPGAYRLVTTSECSKEPKHAVYPA